ncbi:MAG TPA: iron-containing alcohol dehydrogenase, partial [Candidatus Paceibacterota bacterium]|nr:iron-containing alcohol dehydrogenase [Candidatus Paceibacterota bacterium]
TPQPHSKDFNTAQKILHRLTTLNATRQSCVIAIGGGYVGDVVGFAAAIYMRGIHFIQIPTTLMAQGDAIIGKVAINFDGKKNQLGAFYSPRVVFCDTSFLKDFSLEEQAYGLVEIWKHALLIKDSEIVKRVERLLDSEDETTDYADLIAFSLQTKAGFVEHDPEDIKGLHKALSLGHTIANLLETKLRFRHGLAVFYGLIFEALLAKHLGKISEEHFHAIVQTAASFERRFRKLPQVRGFLKKIKLANALKGDKINSHGTYTFVIPTDDGYELAKDLSADTLNQASSLLVTFRI